MIHTSPLLFNCVITCVYQNLTFSCSTTLVLYTMKTVTSAQVHINILGAVTCFSLFLFAFCTSQTERWSTLIVCIRKLKQQKGDMNFLSSRPLWDISTDTEQVPVHAPNIVIPITQCGHVLFSILCWWCILYYNGTTQNWWNRWLVRAPELTWWKGLHVHLLNSPSGLVTETFVGMSKLFAVFLIPTEFVW